MTRDTVTAGRLIVVAALILIGPCAALGQSLPIPIPKNTILPNYDTVFIGTVEALEAGAYLARTDDASASFYNPAGLAAAAKTSLSASANGFYWTQLTSQAFGQTTSTLQFGSTSGYFAIVIGPPFINDDRLRLGFSITNAVSWTPGGIDEASQASPGTIPAVTYSSHVNFSTATPAVSLGYRLSPSVRLGFSTGVSYTSYSDLDTLSGATTLSGQAANFYSSLRASGGVYHLALSAGAQWDVTPQLTLGALVRAPGLRLLSTSLMTYESSVDQSGTASAAYFRDDSAAFQYKLPVEVSGGVAYRFGRLQTEVDVRYHGSAGVYTMYSSTHPITVQTHDGTTTTSNQPFPAIPYSSRQVVNVAVGARYQLSRLVTLHGGFFASFSPIGNPVDSPFQKADVYGGTAGAAVTGEHWSWSLGFAYQAANSTAVLSGVDGGPAPTRLDWRSVTMLYSLSYRF